MKKTVYVRHDTVFFVGAICNGRRHPRKETTEE